MCEEVTYHTLLANPVKSTSVRFAKIAVLSASVRAAVTLSWPATGWHPHSSFLLVQMTEPYPQSESNFINTVIKQEGNYSKYWKNVRVIHELRGDRVLFDTQGINDAKEIYSEIVCTVPPASQLSRPARAPQRRDRGGLASLGSPGKAGGRARRPARGHGWRRRFRAGPCGAEGAARPRAAEGAPGRSPCARTAAPRRRACASRVPTRAWQWRPQGEAGAPLSPRGRAPGCR